MKCQIDVRSIAEFPKTTTEMPRVEPPEGAGRAHSVYDLLGASLGYFPVDIDPNEYVRRLREGDD